MTSKMSQWTSCSRSNEKARVRPLSPPSFTEFYFYYSKWTPSRWIDLHSSQCPAKYNGLNQKTFLPVSAKLLYSSEQISWTCLLCLHGPSRGKWPYQITPTSRTLYLKRQMLDHICECALASIWWFTETELWLLSSHEILPWFLFFLSTQWEQKTLKTGAYDRKAFPKGTCQLGMKRGKRNLATSKVWSIYIFLSFKVTL